MVPAAGIADDKRRCAENADQHDERAEGVSGGDGFEAARAGEENDQDGGDDDADLDIHARGDVEDEGKAFILIGADGNHCQGDDAAGDNVSEAAVFLFQEFRERADTGFANFAGEGEEDDDGADRRNEKEDAGPDAVRVGERVAAAGDRAVSYVGCEEGSDEDNRGQAFSGKDIVLNVFDLAGAVDAHADQDDEIGDNKDEQRRFCDTFLHKVSSFSMTSPYMMSVPFCGKWISGEFI